MTDYIWKLRAQELLHSRCSGDFYWKIVSILFSKLVFEKF